jgi:hypothetical protein
MGRVEEQKSRGAEEQRSRRAEEQRSRRAEEQMNRSYRAVSSAPLLFCSSALR